MGLRRCSLHLILMSATDDSAEAADAGLMVMAPIIEQAPKPLPQRLQAAFTPLGASLP